MNKEFWLVDVWRNGIAVDFWTVNHFLAGVLLGYAARFFGLEFELALIISFCIMVAWEIYEVLRSNTRESFYNQFFDVIFGLAGFILLFVFISKMDQTAYSAIFIFLFILFVLLELWGLNGYRMRQEKK